MDLGLLTGWAAGGPAAPADTPARTANGAAPAAADANALVSAFVGLFDALADTAAAPQKAAAEAAPEEAVAPQNVPVAQDVLDMQSAFAPRPATESDQKQLELPAAAPAEEFERLRKCGDDDSDAEERIDVIDSSAASLVLPQPQPIEAPVVTAAAAESVETPTPLKKAGHRPEGPAPSPDTSSETTTISMRKHGAAAELPANGNNDPQSTSDTHTNGGQAKSSPGRSFLASAPSLSEQVPPTDAATSAKFEVVVDARLERAAAHGFTPIGPGNPEPVKPAPVPARAATIAPPFAGLVLLPPTATAAAARVVTVETSIPDPVPAAVTPQIVQAIRLAWTRNIGEAHIKLDPRQFGDVSVTLRVVDGGVVARVQADEPVVREWLQTNQRVLQGALAERQLTLQRLEIAEASDERRDATDRGRRDRDELTQEPRPRRPRGRDNQNTFEVVA